MPNHRLPCQVGLRYGRLVVLKELRVGFKVLHCRYRCDCGALIIRRHGNVRGAASRGASPCCYKCFKAGSAANGRKQRTHGFSKTKIYDVYKQMLRRCYEPSCKDYKNWGARGIKVCRAWRTDIASFMAWAKASGYRANVTIERKNVNGNYTPRNCTWIDNRDQARNRTNHHILNYNGESHSVTEWGRKLGIKYTTIQSRLRYGFPIERVLTP